jgi:hypothetical protein
MGIWLVRDIPGISVTDLTKRNSDRWLKSRNIVQPCRVHELSRSENIARDPMKFAELVGTVVEARVDRDSVADRLHREEYPPVSSRGL